MCIKCTCHLHKDKYHAAFHPWLQSYIPSGKVAGTRNYMNYIRLTKTQFDDTAVALSKSEKKRKKKISLAMISHFTGDPLATK